MTVHTQRRSIQSTIDVCASIDDETKCVDEASCDIDYTEVKLTAEDDQLTTEVPDDDNVWCSVSLTSLINALKI